MELIKNNPLKFISNGVAMLITIFVLSSFIEFRKEPKEIIQFVKNEKINLPKLTLGQINIEMKMDSTDLIKNLEFSRTNLMSYIKELDIKYPEIVMAQAILESGHFKSKLFKNNNNLFGFRQAKRRETTSIGTKNGYAYYKSWRESVIDYQMYSKRYLSHIKTEEEYIKYLNKHYSESKNYGIVLKKIIKRVKNEN
jgi:uncharacterized FlgJ-related protein